MTKNMNMIYLNNIMILKQFLGEEEEEEEK
jgi:hypothetical protein